MLEGKGKIEIKIIDCIQCKEIASKLLLLHSSLEEKHRLTTFKV